MTADADCVAFLQWALLRLGRQWGGYRKVRRQVCRRVRRRAGELGCGALDGYRAYLEAHPDEWARLDALTNVTISRFYRDHGVFAFLQSDVLPALPEPIRVWSAGCASGEEPYTLAIMAELTGVRVEILATDLDAVVLRRAAAARYPPSAVRELPEHWRAAAFDRGGDDYVLRDRFRRRVALARHDIRTGPPDGPFDLVLCRYLAFTYFDTAGQRATQRRIAAATRTGGALVLGTHEQLPAGEPGFAPWSERHGVYRRLTASPAPA